MFRNFTFTSLSSIYENQLIDAVPPPSPLTPRLPTTPIPKSTPIAEKITAPETPVPSTPTIATGDDSNDASLASLTATPRQSGSMVTHHDDVVTRMKNIEMIELGKHQIKPWYFAPYPQVCFYKIRWQIVFFFNLSYFSCFVCRKCVESHVFIFVNFA